MRKFLNSFIIPTRMLTICQLGACHLPIVRPLLQQLQFPLRQRASPKWWRPLDNTPCHLALQAARTLRRRRFIIPDRSTATNILPSLITSTIASKIVIQSFNIS